MRVNHSPLVNELMKKAGSSYEDISDKNSAENLQNESPVDNQITSQETVQKPFTHRLVDFFINYKISDF